MSKESVRQLVDRKEAEALRYSNSVVRLVGEIELEARKMASRVLDSNVLKLDSNSVLLVHLVNELVFCELEWERLKKELIALESFDF